MPAPLSRILPIVVTSMLVVPGARAQSLASRIDGADGTIRLNIPARSGVCGNGTFIGEETATEFRSYTMLSNGFMTSRSEDFQPTCRTGPIRLAMERSAGAVHRLRAAVGVEWRPDASVTDLGQVRAAEAVTWLLDQAPHLDEDDARVAFLVAAMADAEVAERLLRILGDPSHPPAVRREAMRWVRGPAEREGMADRADRTLRGIVATASETSDLRAYALRRLGESRTDGNAAWIRDVALDHAQPSALRERAIRVLGEEMERPDLVREIFPRLDRAQLKERAVRTVAGRPGGDVDDWLGGTAESLAWIVTIARDDSERSSLRDRAVRVLADHGAGTGDLVRLYDQVGDRTVRIRLIRIFADRGDQVSLDKLGAIMRNDPDEALRREAARRVADRGR